MIKKDSGMSENPRVIDDNNSNIIVSLNGVDLRQWEYNTEDERQLKIHLAREFVEGYCRASDKKLSTVKRKK